MAILVIKFPANARIVKEVILVTEVKIVKEVKTVKQVRIDQKQKVPNDLLA